MAEAVAARASGAEAVALAESKSESALPWEPVPGQPGHYFYAYPHGEAFEALQSKRTELNKAIGNYQETLAKRVADLKWRQSHRPELAEGYAAKKVEPLVEAITLWNAELEQVNAQIDEAVAAAQKPVYDFKETLADEVIHRFAAEGITITSTYGDIVVADEGDYPEARIMLPRERWDTTGRDWTSVSFQSADITFGSSSDKSIDMARKVRRVLGIAIEIAEYINRVYDL